MMRIIIILAMFSVVIFSQSNVWVKSTNLFAEEPGCKHMSAMVYSADSNRFFSTLGWVFNGSWNPVSRYADLSLRLPDTRWINHFPKDSLFTHWGDSTGNAIGGGVNFSGLLSLTAGFMRPGLFTSAYRSFYQYAYNSDDQSIYHYMANKLLRYNTRTRIWDTLSTGIHPANSEGGDWPLIWGAICYDAYNKEIVLFGGADVDVRNGNCGTWTYSPAANKWTKLALSVEPPPRCYSQLVYDAKNRCIIVFGGDHLDYLTADTWVYDCVAKQWSKKNPTRSPSPRAGHALLYLPKSRSVVLIGGYNYTSGYSAVNPFEMWRYDVTVDEWKLIKEFGANDV
ncbi:MAG: hypothetical protein JNL74_04585, partial [Fibrobacteres bacterium]|nr:hypothetical protein [Fibrobacterota bacterium]